MPSVYVNPRESSTCTAHLYIKSCPTTEAWLPRLHAIAVDATKRFRGRLGYFTLDQMNSIEGIFEALENPTHGSRPSTHCGRTL